MIGEPPSSEPLVAAALALLFAALFACADTALTSLSSARLEALAQEAKPRFKRSIERLVVNRERIQMRYLSARILALFAAAAAVALFVSGLSDPTVRLGACVAALVSCTVVIGVATQLGRRAANTIVPLSAVALRPVELAMTPLALIPNLLSRAIPEFDRKNAAKFTEAEVEHLVNEGQESGVLGAQPAEIIRNVLDFSDLTVRQVMVRRTKVTAIRLDTPIDDVLTIIDETGHSRYPVYREEVDDVFALLYTKDLFRVVKSSWPPPSERQVEAKRDTRLEEVIRAPIQLVSESQGLTSVLQQMRKQRQHMAVVVDEYGGMTGILTLEDLLEEIVGDIQDESDQEVSPIIELGDGRLMADGGVSMAQLADYLETEVEPDMQYDSVAGMITERLGHVPAKGTRIPAFGVEFIVRESDEKHVSRVEIVLPSPAQ
ncbi:MAG: hemolysin family protein [Polyangiaceae bacterium]